MKALRDGLLFCLALNISLVLVESDSSVMVQAMRAGYIENWQLGYQFKEWYKLLSPSSEITHGFRQKNHVADRLAAFAHSSKVNQEFFRMYDLPREERRVFMTDLIGL